MNQIIRKPIMIFVLKELIQIAQMGKNDTLCNLLKAILTFPNDS